MKIIYTNPNDALPDQFMPKHWNEEERNDFLETEATPADVDQPEQKEESSFMFSNIYTEEDYRNRFEFGEKQLNQFLSDKPAELDAAALSEANDCLYGEIYLLAGETTPEAIEQLNEMYLKQVDFLHGEPSKEDIAHFIADYHGQLVKLNPFHDHNFEFSLAVMSHQIESYLSPLAQPNIHLEDFKKLSLQASYGDFQPMGRMIQQAVELAEKMAEQARQQIQQTTLKP